MTFRDVLIWYELNHPDWRLAWAVAILVIPWGPVLWLHFTGYHRLEPFSGFLIVVLALLSTRWMK